MSDFTYTMSVAISGMDDPATEAFLAVAMRDNHDYAMAEAHWNAADEDLRDALAPFLGFAPPTTERAPIPRGVMRAYMAALDAAAEAIGDPA